MGAVRFFLALSVAVTHGSGGKFLGATALLNPITAVQGFYIISGFLITMVLNERREYHRLGNFYISRYLRLWPTYFVVAVLSLIFVKWNMIFGNLDKMAPLTIAFVWLSNITLFVQDWFVFLRVDDGVLSLTNDFRAAPAPLIVDYLMAPQCWTLGVEMTFYAIAPFLCRRWWGAVVLFAIGATVRMAIAISHLPVDPWRYRFAPAEMMLFASGSIAYFAGRSLPRHFSRRALTLSATVAVGALCFIVLVENLSEPLYRHYFGGYMASINLANWQTLLVIALSCPFLFYGTRSVVADNLLGELSYPIYVSHIFVHDVAWHLYLGAPLAVQGGVYLLCVIAFSAALFWFVARPIDRLRARFGARDPTDGLRAGEGLVDDPKASAAAL